MQKHRFARKLNEFRCVVEVETQTLGENARIRVRLAFQANQIEQQLEKVPVRGPIFINLARICS